MPFQKGNKHSKGRPKGALNKATLRRKEFEASKVWDDFAGKMQGWTKAVIDIMDRLADEAESEDDEKKKAEKTDKFLALYFKFLPMFTMPVRAVNTEEKEETPNDYDGLTIEELEKKRDELKKNTDSRN